MYVTAQRVRRGTDFGINAFLFRHGDTQVPGGWAQPDLPDIARGVPGERVAEHVELAPPGNDVLSYLDLAAHDETDLALVEAALEHTRLQAVATGHFVRDFGGPIAVWFNFTNSTLYGRSIDEEFQSLRDVLLDVLRGRGRISVSGPPLRVLKRRSDDNAGFVYSLEAASRDRAIDAITGAGRDIYPAAVSIGDDVAAQMGMLHGPIMSHILLAVTGLEPQQLLLLGGVEVINTATGAVEYSWPGANPQLP